MVCLGGCKDIDVEYLARNNKLTPSFPKYHDRWVIAQGGIPLSISKENKIIEIVNDDNTRVLYPENIKEEDYEVDDNAGADLNVLPSE
jgi:hypothetical protein